MSITMNEAQPLAAIRQLAETRSPVLVAIDGRCAAGKTTLANRWSVAFGWNVVHLDDFFLRPEQRSPQRYAVPGENVDHERFLAEVLDPLRMGQMPVYRPFDCHTMALTEPRTIPLAPIVLVEGSYACHPDLWDRYDLRLFVTVDPDEQLRRILTRNGPDAARVFQDRWIPLEERYFAAYQVQERCDFCLEIDRH